MEAIEYLRDKTDISHQISFDEKSIDMAFRMIAENIDDILAYDGVNMSRIVENGMIFG